MGTGRWVLGDGYWEMGAGRWVLKNEGRKKAVPGKDGFEWGF
jgi:hypothetical protein